MTEEIGLTPEQAALVRKWRVDDGDSWRTVAVKAYHQFQGTWEPPSNQIIGMLLCAVAAEHFGEDPGEDPWN